MSVAPKKTYYATMANLWLVIWLVIAICGIAIFVDWFYKVFPRLEKLSSPQIWAIWVGFSLLGLLIAVVIGNNS